MAREYAISGKKAGMSEADLRNLPDNEEFTVKFDEGRKVMRRTAKAYSGPADAVREKLRRLREEDEALAVIVKGGRR